MSFVLHCPGYIKTELGTAVEKNAEKGLKKKKKFVKGTNQRDLERHKHLDATQTGKQAGSTAPPYVQQKKVYILRDLRRNYGAKKKHLLC